MLMVIPICLLVGCSQMLPKDVPRETSTALKDPRTTTLGQNFADLEEAHPEKSGYYLLSDGVDAFVARLLLMEAAQKTIDVQYYIYRFDIAGQMFARTLLEAADRGVRVRLLLDDMEIENNDRRFAILAAHPNIHVRFFNPFAGRSGISRLWSFLVDFERVNQRMHNKIFAVDNQIAIVGGRNLADEYFSVEPNQYFSDLDLLAVGPIVREASDSFDQFWNYDLALPVNALVRKEVTDKDLKNFRKKLGAFWKENKTHQFFQRLENSDFKKRITEHNLSLVWAPGKVIYDDPEQVSGKRAGQDQLTLVGSYFEPHLQYTDEEFILISPYLIPGTNGMQLFRKLRGRGVKFGILTNSLAATDISVVYGAYADYRRPLLEMGIDLYELKPSADTNLDNARGTSVGATLHAKTMVFDRSEIFVGSMNLDPRSVHYNTELGFIVTSPILAEQVYDLFKQMTKLEASLRLSIEDDDVLWTTREDGAEVRYRRPPYVPFWQVIWSDLSEWLIPNSLL